MVPSRVTRLSYWTYDHLLKQKPTKQALAARLSVWRTMLSELESYAACLCIYPIIQANRKHSYYINFLEKYKQQPVTFSLGVLSVRTHELTGLQKGKRYNPALCPDVPSWF